MTIYYSCVMSVGSSSREECVEATWTHGGNGGGPVGEENGRIQCERCEVERKAIIQSK